MLVKNSFLSIWMLMFPSIQSARDIRKNVTQSCLQLATYQEEDIQARKQYWYTHAKFLSKLLRNADVRTGLNNCGVNYEIAATLDAANIANIIDQLVANDAALDVLLTAFTNMHVLSEPADAAMPEAEGVVDLVVQADAIDIINQKVAAGFVPVINNAANSNRDGAAKYKRGTLEEAIARCTAAGFGMPAHFRQVDMDNGEPGAQPVDLVDYKRRYMRWFLSVLAKALRDPNYLASPVAMRDILGCGTDHYCNDPIGFDIQNVVYEIPSCSGLIERCAFFDSRALVSHDALSTALSEPTAQIGREICVISTAAPDRRKLFFIDRYATTSPVLQNSRTAYLRDMIEGSIEFQCNEALKLYAAGKPVYLIFILPGCGAFNNPFEETARIFLQKIKDKMQELRSDGNVIPFCIADRTPGTCDQLKRIGREIGLIDDANHLLVHAPVQAAALLVPPEMRLPVANNGSGEELGLDGNPAAGDEDQQAAALVISD